MLATATGLSAQNQRTSLFEEFTGETCPPCAATNPGLDALLKSGTNPSKIIPIKWQVPIPSAPTPTWSLYKTNKVEIDWRYATYGYGINSAPNCRIDGQNGTAFGMQSNHPVYLSNAVIANSSSVTTPFSIGMTRAWNPNFSAVNLTVNIAAAGNFTSTGNLVCRVVMIENEIHFPVQPGTNGEKDFNWVVRKSFPTLQSGTAMSSTWTNGQTQTFVLNCALPSYINDKAQVAFVAFIQDDGNRKVWQAARTNTEAVQNDAKAVAVNIGSMVCTGTVAATAQIMNNGTNAITAMTLVPSIDAVAGTPVTWTGNLAAGASTAIALAGSNLTTGGHTYSVAITGVNSGDYNLVNNNAFTAFVAATSTQTQQVTEGFVASTYPPANWALYNPANGSQMWARTTAAGGQNSTESSKVDFFTISAGTVMDMVLPPMNFSGNQTPQMTFDVAYASYTTENDRLQVLVSKDCGATWNVVYDKQGATLSTAPSVTTAFVPVPSQWRNEAVALTGYTNTPKVTVKFRATSAYGNNLYVDNVNLKQTANPITTVTALADNSADLSSVELFPNPSKGITTLRVVAGTSSTGKVSVLNVLGQEVYSKTLTLDAGENTITIDAAGFASGVYNVVIENTSGKTVKRFTVN